MDLGDAAQAVGTGKALQVHCDGGFSGNAGAAAFVACAIGPASTNMQRLGYIGRYMPSATSAFDAELEAIGMAVQWALQIRQFCMSRQVDCKRVRFKR